MKKIRELIKNLRQTDNPKEQDKIKEEIDKLEEIKNTSNDHKTTTKETP